MLPVSDLKVRDVVCVDGYRLPADYTVKIKYWSYQSLLEKMLTAFFKISLSIWASLSNFFSLMFSFYSSVILALPWPEKLPPLYCSCSRFHLLISSALIPSSSATSLDGFPVRQRLTLDLQQKTGHSVELLTRYKKSWNIPRGWYFFNFFACF